LLSADWVPSSVTVCATRGLLTRCQTPAGSHSRGNADTRNAHNWKVCFVEKL